MGGGSKVEAPKPSEEELQLRREQTELARQQREIIDETMRQQNLLQPILMQQQGYRPIYSQVDPAAVERARIIDLRLGELQGLADNAQVARSMPGTIETPQQLYSMQQQLGNRFEQVYELRQSPYNGESYWTLRQGVDPVLQRGTDFGAIGSEMTSLRQERASLGDRLSAGRITGYELLPEVAEHQRRMRELETQQANITGMLQERTLKALRGELEVDPALERQLTEGRATLADTLRVNLGTGYETSTPGIQALAEYDKRAEELRDAARHAALTESNQFQMAGQDYMSRLDQMRFGNVVGLSNLPFGGAQAIGGASQALQGPLSGYLQDRNMAYNAAVQNAQASGGRAGGIGSALGTIIGGVGGWFLGGPAGAAAGASIGGGGGKLFGG